MRRWKSDRVGSKEAREMIRGTPAHGRRKSATRVKMAHSSFLEGRNVGGGALVIGKDDGEKDAECGIGDVAIVWDGEVAGMAEGLSQAQESRVLILADSQAAIAAVKRAGRTGKARSQHLQKDVNRIAEMRELKLGWVKAVMATD